MLPLRFGQLRQLCAAALRGRGRRNGRMDLGRLALLAFAQVLRLLLLVTPRRRHVFVASWPADEGNAVETVRALLRGYPGRVVWADPPADDRLRHLGIDPAAVVARAKF